MQPLIILVVGYITGCIWGLYLDTSVVPIIFLSIFIFCKIRYSGFILKYKWYIAVFVIAMLVSRVRIRVSRK